MKTYPSENQALGKLRTARRRAVNLAETRIADIHPLRSEGGIPLLVQPCLDGVRLIDWAGHQRDWLAERLLEFGGLLFRGFHLGGAEDLQRFIGAVFQGEMLDYLYRSTPRTRVSGRIFTSTEYPADTMIPLHSESAFASSWPMKIIFYCEQPATEGGETPIADSRGVYRRVPPAIRERFLEKKIMYVRNYAAKGDLDLSWQETFQTTDRNLVNRYCGDMGIQAEWKADQRLRTVQVCQGIARHPQTGEWVWFNQAHLFHISGLKAEVREAILSEYETRDLPRNSYYGDGSEIETPVMDEIREAFRLETVTFPWQAGDILMLDNMLAAHGRRPFSGPRKVLVGMAETCRAAQLVEAKE